MWRFYHSFSLNVLIWDFGHDGLTSCLPRLLCWWAQQSRETTVCCMARSHMAQLTVHNIKYCWAVCNVSKANYRHLTFFASFSDPMHFAWGQREVLSSTFNTLHDVTCKVRIRKFIPTAVTGILCHTFLYMNNLQFVINFTMKPSVHTFDTESSQCSHFYLGYHHSTTPSKPPPLNTHIQLGHEF